MKRGSWYVLIQFTALGILAFSRVGQANTWSYVFGALGIGLGLWAIRSMSRDSLTVVPEVRAGGELTMIGPYRWIRHPMYTGVLLLALGMLMPDLRWWRVMVWIILLVDLLVKLRYEERELGRAYPKYPGYIRRTRRLVPFIW